MSTCLWYIIFSVITHCKASQKKSLNKGTNEFGGGNNMRIFDITARVEERVDIDLTPMLGVVFIMLIFFIVTASFVKERDLDVASSQTDQTAEVDPEKRSIMIRIEESGRVWINETPTNIDGVKPNVKRLSAQSPAAKVLIRPDPHAKTDLMIRVLDQATAAEVQASIVSLVE